MKLSRQDLYELVWSKPSTALVESLGIHATTLKRLCNRYKIPTPPRGYWQKLSAGHQGKRVPLPDPDLVSPIHLSHRSKRLKKAKNVEAIQRPRAIKASQPGVWNEAARQAPQDRAIGSPTSFEPVELIKSVDRRTVTELLGCLVKAADRCDPATAAVLQVWMAEARVALSVSELADNVIHWCSEVAKGAQSPEWLKRAQRNMPVHDQGPS